MNATRLSGILHPSLKVISYTPSYSSHPASPSKLIESIGVYVVSSVLFFNTLPILPPLGRL